jgi:chlorite dismutase
VSTGQDARLDVRERGANQQVSQRRLWMQLHAFGDCRDPKPLVRALEASRIEAVLYRDLNDPRGAAIVAMSEDPAFFVTTLPDVLRAEPFVTLSRKDDFTMFGRTYSTGYEADLDDWLLQRPRRTTLNPDWPWAIWYPLRRTGAFSRLSGKEQGEILREHGTIGHQYGAADLAHDVRLACHGVDRNDNDFVIGLVGRDLYPLSHLVQAMRRTTQTSQYIEKLGPFLVGHAVWQAQLK